jgi:hypothetical protein
MVIALLGGLNAAERYDSLIEVSDPPGEKSFLRRNIVASHRLQIIGNEVFKLLFIANTVGVSIGWIRFSEAGYGRICRGFAVLVLIILGQLRLLVITRRELIFWAGSRFGAIIRARLISRRFLDLSALRPPVPGSVFYRH